ncbi:polysaccharide deacetylase family protein [Salinibacterium sp. ZJ450]|uniref:polysaccharide deacetylase family protein n=1 Tax=Salinibacterium sp. ZJ450 TaxID=2708338 RepID=UPI001421B3A7|nr:polysaccharide deacetylase family protein [Salinibacterium sp. ZJ450]
MSSSTTSVTSAESSTRRPSLRRAVAILGGFLLAVSAVQAAAPANAAITDPQTIVSLTFDDSTAGQASAADILSARDMDATFFTVSGYVGAPGYLTRTQLTAMAAAGHEIGGHTVTHADLTAASPAEAKRQVCIDRSTLLGWGFAVTSFAYPFASVNATAEATARDCGYNSARGLGDIETRFGCSGCGFSEAVPPANPYYTRAPDQFNSTWTLQDLQNAVVNAEERGPGGWLQLTLHGVCSCPTDTLAISPTLLSQFVAWLDPRSETENTIVRTVGQVIGGAVKPAVNVDSLTTPAAGPGVNGIINPSLETQGTTGMPQCWQNYGYGLNTPSFTRVSPGRSGNSAERLTMTAYTDGDARLMPIIDLGECAPTVTPGHTYSLRGWYTSSTVTQFAVYLRSGIGTWTYWTSSPWFAASSTYAQAVWQTPVIPAGATGISFGLNLFQNGQLTTDDYALYDSVGAPGTSTPPPPGTTTITAGTPTISGQARVGRTLTANAGTWTPSGTTFTYQWLSAGQTIAGATARIYVPRTADVGRTLSVRVTGSYQSLTPVAATSGQTATVRR